MYNVKSFIYGDNSMDKHTNQNNYNNRGNYNDYKNRNTYNDTKGANYYRDNDRVINGESVNIDTTLDQISKEIHPGETLILDIGNNYFNQTDEIFDTLVLRGYHVRKSFRNGRNQIIVHRKADYEH